MTTSTKDLGPIGRQLETDRLILRDFEGSDAPVYAEIRRKPEVVAYLSPSERITENADKIASRAINQFMSERCDIGIAPWAIIDRNRSVLLGHAGIRRLGDSAEYELIYLLDSDAWGKRLAFEACTAAISFAAGPLKLTRLIATVDPNNSRSRRLLERLGFVYWRSTAIGDVFLDHFSIDLTSH
jgi:RimJ/RimL family protein N-acetyltransferase